MSILILLFLYFFTFPNSEAEVTRDLCAYSTLRWKNQSEELAPGVVRTFENGVMRIKNNTDQSFDLESQVFEFETDGEFWFGDCDVERILKL